MTKKDFVFIARVIAQANVTPDTRYTMAITFASELADANPRFDTARFMRACEGGK